MRVNRLILALYLCATPLISEQINLRGSLLSELTVKFEFKGGGEHSIGFGLFWFEYHRENFVFLTQQCKTESPCANEGLILDQISFSLNKHEDFGRHNCFLSRDGHTKVLAIYKLKPAGDYFKEISLAWKVNPRERKIEKIPPNQVICVVGQ